MKEVTLSPQGENSRFREIVTLLKLLFCEINKILLISRRLLQNPCESYLYPSTKYICIIPLVSLYLPWFRFVSQNRISPLTMDNANSLAATHRRRPHCV